MASDPSRDELPEKARLFLAFLDALQARNPDPTRVDLRTIEPALAEATGLEGPELRAAAQRMLDTYSRLSEHDDDE